MTQVVVGLLEGLGPKEIADRMEIPVRRITRWQKDPTFQLLYDETEAELLAQIRSEAAGLISAKLDVLGPKAVAVLEEALASEKMSDRLNAAKAVLSFKGVGKGAAPAETKVVSIEARIKERAVDVSPSSGD